MSNLPNPPFQTGIQLMGAGGNRVTFPWQQWFSLLQQRINSFTGSGSGLLAGNGQGGVSGVTIGAGLSLVNGVLSVTGASIGYGSFYDDTNQVLAAANQSQLVTISTQELTKNVSLQLPGRIVFGVAGIYNVQYSIQLSNSDSQDHDAVIWFAQNATNIPNSASQITIPSKHGGTNGHFICVCNVFVQAAAGDFVELYWSGENTALYLETIPENTIDNMPQSPSVILTVTEA